MNGKIVLEYWKKVYNNKYFKNIDLYGGAKYSKEWYVQRDSIAQTLLVLQEANDITLDEKTNLLKMLHSKDTENWVVLESIIESINTDKQLPDNY